MARNRFEARARAAKVAKLVRLITGLVAPLRLTPAGAGYLISELVRSWGDSEWQQAAIQVGAPRVGIESRLAVLEHFAKRQRRAA